MPRENLTTLIALAVCSIWMIVALVSLYTRDYTPLTIVTPVMLIVAGFLFGYRGVKLNGK